MSKNTTSHCANLLRNPQNPNSIMCRSAIQTFTKRDNKCGRNTDTDDTDYSVSLNKGTNIVVRRSQWPRGLKRGSGSARTAEIVGSDPTGGMKVCLL